MTGSTSQSLEKLTDKYINSFGVLERFKNFISDDGSLDKEILKLSNSLGIRDLDCPINPKVSDENLGRIYFELGYVDANLRESVGLGHARLISKLHCEKLRNHYLETIVNDGLLCGIALTEEHKGGDFRQCNSSYSVVSGGYIINFRKTYVARVSESDLFIILARDGDKVSLFLVPIEKIKVTNIFDAPGLKGWSFGEISGSNIFIPQNHIIGNEGDGIECFNDHFSRWRILMVLLSLGGLQRCYDKALYHAKGRNIRGRKLISNLSVKKRLSKSIYIINSIYSSSIDILSRDYDQSYYFDACALKSNAIDDIISCILDLMDIIGVRSYIDPEFIACLHNTIGFKFADGPSDTLDNAIY
ncbi:TPA: acyl-CoA dehydrogenase family protein [Vibrio vulnificus]|nr:Acyl-CoA dehydrogenase [Vibrio vulnificus]OJI56083.1 Acyl-CoA dehydrogenase [Vibrio fluvialis]